MTHEKDNTEAQEIECLEAIDALYAYLDGELQDDQTLANFKEHLNHCHSCYTRSQLEGVISERIKLSGQHKTPDSLHKRLHQLLDDF